MQPRATIAEDQQSVWVIDPTHTSVEFTVKKLFFFTVKGSVATQEGVIVLDAGDISRSSVTVVLQATGIDSGNKQRDTQLRSKKFLEADRYPEIRFQSTKVAPGIDRDTLRVTGELTIKEKSREVVLDVSDIDRSRAPSGEHVAYYGARTELDRHDFGIDQMGLLIGRKLQVTINVQAIRRA